MGKRIKFDVRDLLFPEQHSPNENDVAMRLAQSPIFKIITQIYSQSNKTLKVGKFISSNFLKVNMVNSLGLLVCSVSTNGQPIKEDGGCGEIKFHTSWHPHSKSADNCHLCTVNPRYLQSKIKPDLPIGKCLEDSTKKAEYFIGDKLYNIVDSFIDLEYGSNISSMPK